MNKKIKKVDWLAAQEYTVLRIDVPRNNEKSPMAAEQMFAAIHGIYSESAEFQNHLSFEIVSKDKFIQFYIYLPLHLKDFVEGQIYAQYPTVEINEVDDYAQNASIGSKDYAICELNLTKPDVYPIKTFTDFDVDPISSITSVMTKLGEDEEVWVQFVIKPIGDEWQEKGHEMVSSVRNGTNIAKVGLGRAIASGFAKFGKALVLQAIRPGVDLDQPEKEVKLPSAVEDALKNIELKITKLGFETKIRVLALGTDPTLTKAKCQNIAATFKQFNSTTLNGFKIGEVHINNQTSFKDFVYRSFEDDGAILNIAEIASIFHLPSSSVSTPNIVWSGSKKGEPPSNLPLRTNTEESQFTVLGLTNFRNNLQEFGIKTDDRRRHIYIIGKSGTGKSTLIENMVINDIAAGKGVILIDPHGETADKILACTPDSRINDVIVFDPSDREFPVAFNLLETVDDDFKGIVASGFVGIFKKIFGESWGPRLEHILRNTVLALLDCPDSTMLDIPKMLTNNRFRDKIVEQVKDSVIRDFWVNEFAQYDSKFRTEAVSPILNKVGQFLATSTIRNIVGQAHSRLNIREVMDQQKVMIVNLSRGKIGEDNSALLGAMMITKIQLAAMSRADVTIENRPDCFLYVDEFQNFATDSFATILSEARKYNLSLTIAHQYIAQMPDPVKEAVFGNAGTLISFRVGGSDAVTLVKEYAPVFEENDMVNLEKAHIYIKLLIDGIAPPAFSARTLPPVAKLTGNYDQVVNQSHQKYSVARSTVEAQIDGKSSQEEEELKREAEIFKSGGLEALLTKRGAASPSSEPEDRAPEKETVNSAFIPEEAQAEPKPLVDSEPEDKPVYKSEPVSQPESAKLEEHANREDVASVKHESHEKPEEPTKSDEPRILKWQNVIEGKVYKERTARGNVKWYVGDEVDEEKLLKAGVVLDDKAKRIIALTAKLADHDGTQKKNVVGESDSIRPEKVDNLLEPKEVPSTAIVESNLLPEIAPNILPAFQPENLPEKHEADSPALAHSILSPNEEKELPKTDHAEAPTKHAESHHVTHHHATHLAEGQSVKLHHKEEDK
ncbi:MAG: DUF87 domain-containing protein [Patescibacteria group bacterium]|jgi:hypothetical protein